MELATRAHQKSAKGFSCRTEWLGVEEFTKGYQGV